MLKEFENWIEVSTNGDRKVSQQLINALSAANWKDLNFDSPENIVIGGDLYVSGVKFDSSTNTFTFTMSDGTTIIAKVGSSSQENITLENDKGVQGKGSNGDSYNLIKVSSMNTTEVGSTSSPMNLNSSEIPTIQIPNQSPKTLAISTDIEDVNSKIATVNSNLVQSIDSLNKNMADGFNTINGGINNEIRPEIDKKANSSEVYTKKETDERIQSIVDAAPEALDTLKEIAEALDNNPNFASAITNELTKVNSELDSVKSELDTQVESINSSVSSKFDEVNNIINSEIKPDLDKSVKFKEFIYNDESTRKTIQLDNHDTISGIMTDGTGVNIAMVSKWDTVDLGSPSLPINLNTPMGVRPTVQEKGQSGEEANKIAYVSDVDEVKESIRPIKSKLDTIEDGAQVNRIENIKINGLAQEIGSEDKSVNIDLTGKVDKEEGKVLSSNDFTNEYISAIENSATKNELSDAVKDSVKYQDFVYGDQTRKTIQLPNYDSISSVMTNGTGVNVVMVNKWDVVDLGSPNLPINLNTPAGVRPTVQEPGQSGEEAYKIAYTSDLNTLATKEELAEVESKIETGGVDAYTKSESDSRYVAKEEGKGLSSNDYTNEDKSELVKLRTDINYEGSRALEAESNINKELAKKVNFDESGKIIVLPDGGKLSGTMADGDGAVLAQINEWGVTDLGSSKLPTTINSSERPKVQLPGQTGETAEKIAFLSDITEHTDAYTKKESDEKFVAKVSGKGLSSNDFTSEMKSKLDSIDLSAYYTKFESDEKYALKTDITDHIDAYTKSEVDSKLDLKANLTDIPSELPNPNALTIKYNGQIAFTYDGSSAEVGNFEVTADTVPGIDDKINSAISGKVDKVEGKGLSTNDYTNEAVAELSKLRTDVDYVGGLIPEMNTNTSKALALKVDWDSEKKVISLPKDGSISALRDESTLEGGVLLAQRTYDDGATFVTEVGTTKNSLTINSNKRPQIDLKIDESTSSESVAYLSEVEELRSLIESLTNRITALEGSI